MKFRLSDPDRERLGCPEWLDVDLVTLPVQEGIELERVTRLTAGEILDAIQPVMKPIDGGTNVSFTALGTKIRVWLGLQRAGIEVDFEELTFDLTAFGGVHFVAAPETPGKAPSSPNNSPTTPSTSRTSGRRTRSSKSAS